jgi:beta-galactosidase
MNRTSFNSGWSVRDKVNPFDEASSQGVSYAPVALPHDALIGKVRQPTGRGANAYFPPATVQYRKAFTVPDAPDDRVLLEFEGVYRDALVYVNGALAGHRPNGYSAFIVELTPHLLPNRNEIVVEARSNDDSRWYTGVGIYRDVWMLRGGPAHIASKGVHITTPDIEADQAVVEVALTVDSTFRRLQTVELDVEITDPDGVLAATSFATVTIAPGEPAVSRQRLYVPSPRLWSADTPDLYTATARVRSGDDTLDEIVETFGIRTLQLDPRNGLRINGESVKLRGTCLHHDNGILGAASFAAADERRVRLLKAAGFNAIRSAHNPISRALLDACDRIGMYVMDEAFDMWESTKNGSDYALAFPEWWQRDLQAMVEKDRNHPSVIMYCLGNEIPETGSPSGGLVGRRLAEEVRRLDPTRFITNGINGLLAVMGDLARLSEEHGAAAAMESIGINTMMATSGGDYMNLIGTSDLVTRKTAESFGLLDVAGMNYLDSRYELDATLFPNRIIVGTETFPGRIDETWAVVRTSSHVIGDFTWTGWDYLGEVGLGRSVAPVEGELGADLSAPYPWIAAWCGDIDLVGHRRPASFYREIVFGLRTAPYIAVVRPDSTAPTIPSSSWAWSDSVASWTWPDSIGHHLTVEVYSDADIIELVLNGRSLGQEKAGPDNRFRCKFTVPYEPGELVAIAHRTDGISESHGLRTADGTPAIRLIPEYQDGATPDELMFVSIEFVDGLGTPFFDERSITVEVSGSAVLQALGSADPAPFDGYAGNTVPTYDGRALAIIRPTGPGEITLSAESPGLPSVSTILTAS